jgi:hypothetical protein
MPHCKTTRYGLVAGDLPRLARALGYDHLARRLARHPGGLAERKLARHLASTAARADHSDHAPGPCRRVGAIGGRSVLLLTTRAGPRHIIRAARWQMPQQRGTEEAEAMFDNVIG